MGHIWFQMLQGAWGSAGVVSHPSFAGWWAMWCQMLQGWVSGCCQSSWFPQFSPVCGGTDGPYGAKMLQDGGQGGRQPSRFS